MVAFPLHPDTPEDGLSLKELFAGRSVDIEQMMVRLKQAAAESGLPFGDRKKTFNSRLAQELGKWAEAEGKGTEYHFAVFQAYFVHGTNIGKIQSLIEVVASVGLDAREAKNVLETRAFKEAVDRDWAHSKAVGVTAVPSFLMNQQAVVGAQPYSVLERFLQENHVKKRDRNLFPKRF